MFKELELVFNVHQKLQYLFLTLVKFLFQLVSSIVDTCPIRLKSLLAEVTSVVVRLNCILKALSIP